MGKPQIRKGSLEAKGKGLWRREAPTSELYDVLITLSAKACYCRSLKAKFKNSVFSCMITCRCGGKYYIINNIV